MYRPVGHWCVSLQQLHNPCVWTPPFHTGPSGSPRSGDAQGWGAVNGSALVGTVPAPPVPERTPQSSSSSRPWISEAPPSGCLG